MDNDIQKIMEEATRYVAETQPLLDKQAEASEHFATELTKTAALLADRGLLEAAKVDDFIEKAAEDHTFVLKYLDRLTKSVTAEQLGGSTGTTKYAENADPFELEFAPELFNDNGQVN